VLELGSGTGLVGMASAILGCETFLTDLAEIVPNLVSNIELNQVECTVHELDWRDPSSFEKTFPNQKFKTIILSDPIYSSLHPQWVFNMVNEFLMDDEDSRVLLQIPLRPKFEKEREKLWSLMSDFVEKESCIEEGFDDFGAMRYSFKLYTRS
jgi:predicted nicotinamide N-methyase